MFELNEQRRAAVAHRGGPLLVQAGAGRHLFAQVSRFLAGEVTALMDHEHVGPPIPLDPADPGDETGGGMDAVDQFLSGLWA